MNASALEVPLQNTENTAKLSAQDTRQVVTCGEQRKLGLGRWWFASELCPLFAGTFGPLATFFTICSLTGGWTSIIAEDENEEHVQNQMNMPWAIALNTICLCLGLMSNGISLFVRWSLPTFVICAVGLSIQCFGLTSLLIANHFSTQPHEWSTKSKLTQAYYYSVFASALSFAALISVVFHGIGVIRTYYAKHTKWDETQKALLRQSICLTAYLIIGSAIFAQIEDWAFLDALFWADFTLLTIGLGGEFTTKTTLGRVLLFPYAILGMVLVALLIISVRKLMKRGRLRATYQLTERYLKQHQTTQTREGVPVYPISDEQAFHLIRHIGLKAEKGCSRIALTISITAALVLLLGGAAIFEIAEEEQGWTYGASCYFAYISLLTIGYGDYVPISEAGKSFFVFWSLLAVPILTIVINNSVDALYGTYRSLLLPFQRLFRDRPCQAITAQQPDGLKVDTQDSNAPNAGNNIESLEFGSKGVARRPLACAQQDEPSEISRNPNNGSSRTALRRHCYLLARELRNTILAMGSDSTKRYTYEEWRYYISLLDRSTDLVEGHRDRSANSEPPVEMQKSPSTLSPVEAIEWTAQTSSLLCNSEPGRISLMLSIRLMELLCRMDTQD
ncbi:voltage-gated potassium channel [Periconia macrospinosa]|uniref:Voltage-gated potassium channel n=1 Tax=Periconia macrospinosa TaxID=97972 RepID=A0A2V1D1C7_9PLEO|nr:voltage-gated potassium channel [Periconia macrospinosa]